MYIFSFRSFIQRAPPRPKSFHASSSSSAEASSIASHIASVTTRARSHRDASIFRVHSFARSRRRAAVRRTVSVIRVIHGRLHLRAQLHLCDASRRRNASSSVRVRAFDAVIARPTARLSSNHRIKITSNPSRDSSVTNEIERAHRRRAIARSPTPRPRRRRRANRRARPSRPWPSTSADERTRATRERTTTTHPHIHDTRIPSTNTYPDSNTHTSTTTHQMSEQLPR